LTQAYKLDIIFYLMSLKIADSPTRHAFLISFQDLCNRYDQLADTKLDNSFKRTLLQASIVHNTALLNSWNTVNEVERAQNPGMPVTVTYSEYFSFVINQSKTHDLATPFKRGTRHAHKANSDSFSDGNDEENNDDDRVLNEVIAHMSIQNEPMSEETVNALQVFSTFQRRRNGPARARDPEEKYHIHFIVRYTKNYALHGHVRTLRSEAYSSMQTASS
jgi:hypothetical protein